MKIIKLNCVHYLSHKGITLTMNKPFIEATEENIKLLSDYIKAGYLEVKELEEEVDKEDEYEATDMSAEEAKFKDNSGEILSIVEYPSREKLEKMNKSELFEELEKFDIEYKKTMKKEELIKLFDI